ncbi:MAG: DUF192 domain-containing protein [Nisaea sp.]|jgi:uncharacterized membrane protein (UPF0127 family)|uniref:DUF192 domain-containing protein n=1 Tax=Nisaea sp. TaxID=2024842 RepID=UPI001B15964B|nr:DUF192 domain-containing protein [Nisaea sp.]MBO6558908.1 DUF192 domain-containing protein [Nisaea sp.]
MKQHPTSSFRKFLRIILLGLIALGAAGPANAADGTSRLVILSAGQEHVFSVEVADTPEARARGLMFREDLAEDAGMLFIYPAKAKVSMWMKNTYVSLDMLFLDRDGTILHIAERTVPRSTDVISSRLRVKAVLEVVAGTVARLGLRAGDRVAHAALEPAR